MEMKKIIEETLRREIRKAIMENTEEVYMIKDKEGNPVEMCDTQEEADQKMASYGTEGKEFIIEKGPKPSIDELDAMGEKLDDMENEQPMDEKLVGNQSKIDANHNGKIDADDFKELKGEKNEEMLEGKYEIDPTYNHFAIHKDSGKIFDGWDFDPELNDRESIKMYSTMDLKDREFNPKHFKVVSHGHLKRNGVDPFNSENWGTSADHEAYINTLDEDQDCAECGSSMDMEEAKEVCTKCGKEMCECGGMSMYEGKKSVTITETELIALIKNIAEAVPGLETYKKAHKGSGEINKAAMSDIDKELKSYLNFDGNENPEFPNQEGGEKVARQPDSEEEDEVADNRGGGMEDLDYDVEPSKQFNERLKMSLVGDTKMGNSHDAANVIPSKLGDKIIKKVERRKKEIAKAPMYEKDPAPTRSVNESEAKDNKVVLEEIKRMKEMLGYNKKTQ
jgi:hypothetical protein